jgi:hypothetical protein
VRPGRRRDRSGGLGLERRDQCVLPRPDEPHVLQVGHVPCKRTCVLGLRVLPGNERCHDGGIEAPMHARLQERNPTATHLRQPDKLAASHAW